MTNPCIHAVELASGDRIAFNGVDCPYCEIERLQGEVGELQWHVNGLKVENAAFAARESALEPSPELSLYPSCGADLGPWNPRTSSDVSIDDQSPLKSTANWSERPCGCIQGESCPKCL